MRVRCFCGQSNRFKGRDSEISRNRAKITCSRCGEELISVKIHNGRFAWQLKGMTQNNPGKEGP